MAGAAGIVLGPEWIAGLTGLEPDGGSGALEFLLALVPAVAAVGIGLLGLRARPIGGRG